MSYRISQECTTCGACIDVCPSDAIVEKEDRYEITDSCEECGSCVDVCFLEAIEEV